MRYFSIYRPAKNAAPDAAPDHMAEMGKLMAEMTRSGQLLATGAWSNRRASARYARGEITVTDGPFAETKEMLAGFALLRFGSKAEAVEGMRRFLRIAGDGTCDVREVFETEDFAPSPDERADGWRDKELAFREADRTPPVLPPPPAGKRRFMALVKADAFTESGEMPSEALLSEMGALMEEMVQAGKLLGGEGLKPSKSGFRVKLDKGEHSVIDGPFAETKEMIAGYSTIEVGSMEEAIDFARRMATIHGRGIAAQAGEVEVVELL